MRCDDVLRGVMCCTAAFDPTGCLYELRTKQLRIQTIACYKIILKVKR